MAETFTTSDNPSSKTFTTSLEEEEGEKSEYHDDLSETLTTPPEEQEYYDNPSDETFTDSSLDEEYEYYANPTKSSAGFSLVKASKYHDNSSKTSGTSSSEEEEEYDNPSSYSELYDNYACRRLSGINKSHLDNGNRIIMPPSALDKLEYVIDESPMTFEITNSECGKVSYCGVLEFSGEEGFVYLPNWMMDNMMFKEGDLVSIKSTSLEKATYMKIQPHKTEFVTKLSNPKIVLENILRDFVCLTVGDTVTLNYGENYKIDIVDLKPDFAVSLFETDCEVDFAQSLDYKEPEKTKVEKTYNFTPFTGVSRRLDGKISTTNPSATSLNAADRTTKAEEEDAKGKKIENVEEKRFQPFTGKKYTLSDNCR